MSLPVVFIVGHLRVSFVPLVEFWSVIVYDGKNRSDTYLHRKHEEPSRFDALDYAALYVSSLNRYYEGVLKRFEGGSDSGS